ncbi:unnamed protein product [Discula destructiva]
MAQPKPKVALNNECSAVYNNTLYTYQVNAFQSLPLETGAVWATLDQGEALSNAVCVNVEPSDASQAALWIVGGTGGSDGYNGLQKYTYATGKWESITPVTPVTQNRINHGAVYLPGSNSLLVYAGSQDGSTGLSTQTFSINASAPYSVLAYEADGAPPTISPTLLRWSDSEAVMVGGSSDNVQVMTFAAGTGWTNSGATLATPLKTGTDKWHASLVTGSDGSKSLYTFDMTVSPNVVNRTLVIDGHGAPVTAAVAISRRSEESQAERRDSVSLSASDWPSYNSTYASTAIRSSSAAADSGDGKIVLSGGNMDDIICVFDETANSWINATQLLVADGDQKTLHASVAPSSTAATATSTASGTSTGTAAAGTAAAAAAKGSSSSSGLSTDQTLGVVLGSIGGAIVFLILVYCQIKKRKRRIDYIQAGHARRASGASVNPEKEGMAVVTESYPRSPTNPNFVRSHQQQDSFSSMAIFTGKGPKASMDGGARPSFGRPGADSRHQLKKSISGPLPTMVMPAIASPSPLQLAAAAREGKGVSFTNDTQDIHAPSRIPAAQQDGTRRSSGWNRYWSGDSQALNILGYGHNADRNTGISEGSHYSTAATAVDPRNRRTQDSATVPSLGMAARSLEHPPRISRVNSGSPTVSSHPSMISEGMSGHIHDGSSLRPTSADSKLSGYSSGVPASVQEHWDPTALSSRPWAGQRAASSMYSVNFPMPPGSPGPMPSMPPALNVHSSDVSQQAPNREAHTSDMSWLNLDLRR